MHFRFHLPAFRCPSSFFCWLPPLVVRLFLAIVTEAVALLEIAFAFAFAAAVAPAVARLLHVVEARR